MLHQFVVWLKSHMTWIYMWNQPLVIRYDRLCCMGQFLARRHGSIQKPWKSEFSVWHRFEVWCQMLSNICFTHDCEAIFSESLSVFTLTKRLQEVFLIIYLRTWLENFTAIFLHARTAMSIHGCLLTISVPCKLTTLRSKKTLKILWPIFIIPSHQIMSISY